MNFIEEVKAIEDEIIEIRRELHKIPELKLELPNTVNFVKSKLDEYGIDYITMVDGNAVVATIKGNGDGKCIAIRADMDALPIEEKTGLPFASTNGCMHACGHDGHTAMALGAAKIIKENSDKFKGYVKFLFQPGEEYPGGARPMIEEGAMENPKVDRVISNHNGKIFEDIKDGNIGFRKGSVMASMDRFYVKVVGKGAHGAKPHISIDPIVIIAEIISSLQNIVSREIDPIEGAVLSVCQVHSGSTQNIIPDEAWIEGTVRALNEDTRKYIANRIKEISENIAKSHRASCQVIYDYKYPVVINDDEFTEFTMDIARKTFGDDTVQIVEKPSMGGEDVSFFLQEAPGTMFFLTNLGTHKDGIKYTHHNNKFTLDESMFWKGTLLFVNTAIEYLNK